MSRNYKVGVLLEWNPSAYSRTLRRHLEAEAPRRGITLGFLGVHWASSGTLDEEDSLASTLASAEAFDAMVLLSGVFAHGVHGLSRFSQRWAPRPAVSIGYRLPGVPSVLVDNRGSVRMATSHLISVHGRRQLLYLRGRRDSQEAEERYLGFRHALRDHGILHDERRVLQGDFTRPSALRLLAGLDPTVVFDAIVAANDDMALAALAEARRRGLDVPRDVAILGFDDIPEAQQAAVPLTTLAQPFAEVAREALRSLEEQAAQRAVAPVTSVPVALVARRSCGCR